MPQAIMCAFCTQGSGNCWTSTLSTQWIGGIRQTKLPNGGTVRRNCAEVLVPERVETRYLTGAYVVDEAAKKRLQSLGLALPATINPMLFFR